MIKDAYQPNQSAPSGKRALLENSKYSVGSVTAKAQGNDRESYL